MGEEFIKRERNSILIVEFDISRVKRVGFRNLDLYNRKVKKL